MCQDSPSRNTSEAHKPPNSFLCSFVIGFFFSLITLEILHCQARSPGHSRFLSVSQLGTDSLKIQLDWHVSKGFLHGKVLGKVSVLEGGQFCSKFLAKFAAKCLGQFSGLFCWDIQGRKTSAKTSAQNSHDSAEQNWQNSGKNFMTRFRRGTPAKAFPSSQSTKFLEITGPSTKMLEMSVSQDFLLPSLQGTKSWNCCMASLIGNSPTIAPRQKPIGLLYSEKSPRP